MTSWMNYLLSAAARGGQTPLQPAPHHHHPAVSISHLTFEHYRVPLGINEPSPRLSWRFAGPAANWTQTGYELEITADGVPQLYSANSSDSLLVPWPAPAIAPGKAATVRVRAHGCNEDTPWSHAATVEVGLLEERDWEGAKVVGLGKDKGSPKHRPVYFRKEFARHANASVERARLWITAQGVYEARLNGHRVGDAVLAPGWQSYQHRHAYQTYDVTDLVQEGKNALGVVVGEGWYAGHIGWADDHDIWGDKLGVLARLRIDYEDGETVDIVSDDTWKAGYGPIVESDLYDGETYDSRLEEKWDVAGFEGKYWKKVVVLPNIRGELVANDGPNMRRLQELEPVEVFKSKTGKTIIDFGQDLVGWVKLHVGGLKGQQIRLVHTEVLENGEVATRPLRKAKATDAFTLNGHHKQHLEPRFTYHGFRFVQIEGWPDDTPIDGKSIKAVAVWADMEPTGKWKSSNKLFNKLHQNIRWGMRGNFLTVPTDCPQRDERLGWTGDAYAFGPTANFLYDTSGFWRAWLKDLKSEQFANDKKIVPFYVPQFEDTTGGTRQARSVWGDVAVGGPYDHFLSFGDLAMLREQYASAEAWIDTAIPRNAAGLWDRSAPQFGDWLDPAAPPDRADQATTSKDLVSDAYLLEMTRLLSELALALGDTTAASRHAAAHKRLLPAYQAAWLNATGFLAQETQTALALSLRFNLFANATQHVAAHERLCRLVEENSFKVGTGFAGTPHLPFALSGGGEEGVKAAYGMLLNPECPGWLYQVLHNATTTWERWDSLLPDGRVNPGSMTSFNHYAFGSVGAWMHAVPAGLVPRAPGWREVGIAPKPGGNLTWVEASYLSGYGKVGVEWKIDDKGFWMETTVPPNTKAWVTVPGEKEVLVGSGVREWKVKGFKVVP